MKKKRVWIMDMNESADVSAEIANNKRSINGVDTIRDKNLSLINFFFGKRELF